MTRLIGYMDKATFERCVELMVRESKGPDRSVNLHNLGESTLHPLLLDCVRMASSRDIVCALSTNGAYLDQDLVYALEDAGLAVLRVSVDALQAEYRYQTKGQMVLKAHAVLSDSLAPTDVYRKGLDDPAGLLAWNGAVSRPKVPCSFLRDGWRVVTWDGSVIPCCLDVNAEYALGNVWDEPEALAIRSPWMPLCESCPGYSMNSAIVSGNYGTGESDVGFFSATVDR